MRILLVEDNADHRELMRLALTGHDATWQVEGVVSGEEALRHLAEGEAYDVVFLDYSLPRRDGLEVLEEIRRGEAPPPVVMVTGRGDEQVAVKAMKGGAYDYIVKGEGYLHRLPVVAQRAVEAHQLAVERKRAEETLRESEERYRRLVENTPEVIYSLSAGDGTITSLNPAFERITGWSRAEWLGKPFMSIIHPDDLSLAVETFQQVLCGEAIPPYELRILSKSGEYLIGEFKSVPNIEKGKVVGEFGIARDITERKRAEEALRESEAQLRELYDEAPVSYHELDGEGRLRRVNRTELAMLGYTAEEMVGRPVWEFVLEREVAHRAVLSKLAGSNLVPAFERTYLRKDGTRVPVLIEDRLLRDAEGRITGIRSTIQDISARKQAEEVALENQEVLEAVLETTRAMIVLADSDGRILLFNRACEELTGYSRQEVLGKPIAECFRDQAWASIALKLLVDPGGPGLLAPHECPWQMTSGEQRLIEWRFRVFPSPRDGRPCVLGTGVDITAHKQAEEALRASQQLLERTFASLCDAVFILDAETVEILDCNPAASEIFGYSHQEMVGRTTTFLHVDEATLEEFRRHLYSAIEQRGFLSHFEFRMKRKDGTVFPTEHSVVPFVDERGKRVGWVSVVRDITERKRAEEVLAERARQLEAVRAVSQEITRELDLSSLLVLILSARKTITLTNMKILVLSRVWPLGESASAARERRRLSDNG